jgi:hypothetical protein
LHKKQISNNKQEYRLAHLEEIRRKKKIYRMNNKEKIQAQHKKYQLSHQEKLRNYFKRYTMKRRKNDINFKLQHNIRNRIGLALKHNHKSAHTLELIGCSIEDLKKHLKLTALQNGYPDFDIENFEGKKWHIDHIIPCCKFDLADPDQQKKCFNYKNLQILSARENMLKGNKL